jgi:hypothetical protein
LDDSYSCATPQTRPKLTEQKNSSREEISKPLIRRSSWPSIFVDEHITDVPDVSSVKSAIFESEAAQAEKSTAVTSSSERIIFVPKCICIVSHFALYRAFRTFLSQIYSISLSSSILPIEAFVAYFVSHVPLPKPGTIVRLQLDGSLVEGPHATSLAPIEMSLPALTRLPAIGIYVLFPLFNLL